MRAGTNLVRWNRFSVPESYNPFVPPPRYHEKYSKKKPPKLWSLDGSIWEPRKAHSNSHDYFETASALNRMVKNDWIVARSHHHLDQYIVKTCRAIRGNPEHLHDGETANQLFNAPEVRAIEEVLYRHARVVYGAFEYYSVTSHMSETGIGLLDTGGRKIGSLAASADQLDVHGITSHGFFQFCTDCAIEEDGCTHSELSGIWRMVNSQDSGTILRAAETEYHNLVTFLTRHEWLQCLVRIAVHLHCRVDPRTGVAGGNVAEALDKMCYSRLAGKLPPEAMQSSDAFRKASCYTEGTDLVLKRHATTLRSLFDHFSAMGTTSYDDEQNLRDQRLMSCGEWLNLLQATGLIEMRLVPSLRAASMAFQWSRIRSLDQYSNRAEIRLRSMQFEDYLEALVRLASICAMPTREELDESESCNAAEFLHALREDVPDAYDEFVQRRTIGFFDVPPQRAHVLLAGLLDVIHANIAAGLAAAKAADQAAHGSFAHRAPPKGSSDSQSRPKPKFMRTISSLHMGAGVAGPQQAGVKKQAGFSAADIAKFSDHRAAGGGMNVQTCRINGVLGTELVEAMSRIEGHIMDALRAVPAFASLDDEQLRLVRSAMQVAKYRDAERVFKQGDEGSAFFLITTGHCEVLRINPEDLVVGVEEQERVVCRLGPSDCFGERALIYNEPRAASVRAGPGCMLYVVFITRERFEQTLGRSLSEFQEELAAKTKASGGMEPSAAEEASEQTDQPSE